MNSLEKINQIINSYLIYHNKLDFEKIGNLITDEITLKTVNSELKITRREFLDRLGEKLLGYDMVKSLFFNRVFNKGDKRVVCKGDIIISYLIEDKKQEIYGNCEYSLVEIDKTWKIEKLWIEKSGEYGEPLEKIAKERASRDEML